MKNYTIGFLTADNYIFNIPNPATSKNMPSIPVSKSNLEYNAAIVGAAVDRGLKK